MQPHKPTQIAAHLILPNPTQSKILRQLINLLIKTTNKILPVTIGLLFLDKIIPND
jgi:hypothetical protein